MDLQTKGWFNPGPSPIGPQQYSTYAAACSEVEVDVLTGEIQILRNDILFDCGVSMNPAVDIGQIIGGFTMGLGTPHL
jgi:xanthine dehydrogenase molybdopterin-binding subunit B